MAQIVAPLNRSWPAAPLVAVDEGADQRDECDRVVEADHPEQRERGVASVPHAFECLPAGVGSQRNEQDRLRHDGDQPDPPGGLPELPMPLEAHDGERELEQDNCEHRRRGLPPALDGLLGPPLPLARHARILADQRKKSRSDEAAAPCPIGS